jgi:hypothetical protein
MKLTWQSVICWVIWTDKLNLNRRITTTEKIIYNFSAYILNRLSFDLPFQITCNGVTWNSSIGYKTMGTILKRSWNKFRHTWCCSEINAVLFMFIFLNNWILQMNHSKFVQDAIWLACDRSRLLKYCRTVNICMRQKHNSWVRIWANQNTLKYFLTVSIWHNIQERLNKNVIFKL